MRQIEFRVYDKVMKRYNRDQQTFFLDEFGDLWMDADPKGKDMSGCTKIYKAPERWIYEQYTGLKDMNGHKVFEGDMVVHHLNEKNEDIGVIEFCYDTWRFVYPDLDSSISIPSERYLEVVGTIHE